MPLYDRFFAAFINHNYHRVVYLEKIVANDRVPALDLISEEITPAISVRPAVLPCWTACSAQCNFKVTFYTKKTVNE